MSTSTCWKKALLFLLLRVVLFHVQLCSNCVCPCVCAFPNRSLDVSTTKLWFWCLTVPVCSSTLNTGVCAQLLNCRVVGSIPSSKCAKVFLDRILIVMAGKHLAQCCPAGCVCVCVCIHERTANTLTLLVKPQVKGAMLLWLSWEPAEDNCRKHMVYLEKHPLQTQSTMEMGHQQLRHTPGTDLKSTLSVRADMLSVLFIWKRPTSPKKTLTTKKQTFSNLRSELLSKLHYQTVSMRVRADISVPVFVATWPRPWTNYITIYWL